MLAKGKPDIYATVTQILKTDQGLKVSRPSWK
jgi:phage baseplate assembly protein W